MVKKKKAVKKVIKKKKPKRKILKKKVVKKVIKKKKPNKKLLKKKISRKSLTIKSKIKRKPKIYYLDLSFDYKNGVPLIYEFLMFDFPEFCKKNKIKELKLNVDRLEPLKGMYINVDIDAKCIGRVLKKFAKAHHVNLTNHANKRKIDIKAKLTPSALSTVLKDYNQLFDIFFTDTRIESPRINIDVMDFTLNTALLYGDIDLSMSFVRELIRKGTVRKVRNVTKY